MSLSHNLSIPSQSSSMLLNTEDTTLHCFSFLDTPELVVASRVCKTWKGLIDGAGNLWRDASIRQGVPLVEDHVDQDYKREFQVLRPITISSHTIGKYLGEVVEKEPRYISLTGYLRLRDAPDVFEPQKSMHQNYVVVVPPRTLKIQVNANRPLDLDANEVLVEIPANERTNVARDLIVPFSFQNLCMLAKYPITRATPYPVFDETSDKEIFEQCGVNDFGSRIFILRREVVARDMPLEGTEGQRACLQELGWKITPIYCRVLFDAIQILSTGTCPDRKHPFTFALSDELLVTDEVLSRAGVGYFHHQTGLAVEGRLNSCCPEYGVVPGALVEYFKPEE